MLNLHNLKCPVCSKSATFYNSRLYCNTCCFEYFHNVASASVAIIEHNDCILLLKRAKEPMVGKLHLPGGFISANESAEAALIREVNEELGLSVNSISYLFSEPNKYQYSGITYSIVDLFFKIFVDDIEKLTINNESSAYLWHNKYSVIKDDIAFISVANALNKLGYLK